MLPVVVPVASFEPPDPAASAALASNQCLVAHLPVNANPGLLFASFNPL
jgi:hypothetical protein